MSKTGLFAGKNILYLSITMLVVLSLAFLLPVAPNDFWWYVRIGRETLLNGSVPSVDTISYPQYGTPTHYHAWLFSVMSWLVYNAGGISLIVFVRGLLIGLAYLLLWLMIVRMGTGPRFTSLLVLAAALSGGSNWEVRPQMVAYVLFMLSVWVVFDWHRAKNTFLWVLPVVSLIWFNVHGSFVLLFALGGLAFLFGKGDRRALFITLALSLLVTVVTPFERESWLYVFKMLSSQSIQLFSTEWAPPENNHWQMNIFFGWMLAFPLIAVFSKHRLDRFEWALFLFFGWMAFTAQRYVIWQLFFLAIFSAALLKEWGNRFFDRNNQKGIPAINYLLSAIFLMLSLLFLPGVRSLYLEGENAIAVEIDTPRQAAEWLSAHPELPGPLLSDFAFASYLVYALPERPLWADPRFEAYPVEHWEKFRAIDSAAWNWQTLLDEAGINLLMISRTGQPELLAALEKTSVWCQVYNDEMAVIFTRCGAK